MGDLSENGYYKAARARLSFIDAQLRRLERLVKLGRVVDSSGSESVTIGTNVIIDDGLHKFAYQIVGGYESDPSKMTISHLSPIGKALIGKRPGDSIRVETPSGDKIFTLVSLS